MSALNLTHLIAEYIHQTDYTKFPEDVIEKAKLCLLDWIGVTLAGAREPISEITSNLVLGFGGHGQATILGKGWKTNPLFASLINGTNAHALDFDDGVLEGPGHPSAPTIPAILSLAEWKGSSGRDFITAFATAVQVFFSIDAATMPSHSGNGWHSTGTIGHLAAAAGSAKLLGLPIPQIIHALGISVTQAAGLKNAFGTMCKPFHAGKAAMDGLLAALLAERNFTSPVDAISGKGGFLQVYSSRSTPEALREALDGRSFLDEVRFKRYPSCFNTHAAIDCVLSLQDRYAINPEEIMEIECTVYPRCLEVSAIPEPQTGLEAKFSIQYCLAMALQEGKVMINSFDDSKVKGPSLNDLMKKVKLVSEESYSKTRTSKVIIRFKNGKTIQERINLLEVFSDRKREKADAVQKFKDIAYPFMHKERADQIIESVDSLDKMNNLSSLIDLV